MFGSLLTETALEWYTDEVTNATTWAELKNLFLKRFTDGRDRFKHRIDAENATRQEGELIKNYFHRIKTSVDKGWPESIDTTVHADADAQALEKNIQTRQRTQKYIDFSVKGLKPLALKQKAHEYMIENPNAGWGTFTNHIITKDLTFIVATDPANKTSTDKMTSLETQIKELTKLIKNQEVSAINEQHSFRRRDPDVKGSPNNTRFCDYCRMNGHSISRCSKKQVQDEVNKLRKELTIKNDRKVSFETDYKRNRNFSNQRNYHQNDQSRNNNFTNQNGQSGNYGNTPNFQNQSNYGIRYHSNYSKNGYPRNNQQPSYNSNPRQNESYDEKYPKQNTFRDNEQAAKQHYDQENRQSSSDPRGRQYNQNGYNRTNSRDSDRSRSPGFRMNQNQVENTHWVEEETNYCNALTDMFPLNY